MRIKKYHILNRDQERIYYGLKEIGEALASFYIDALLLISPSCILDSKANLIAHLAREIDGGLRDIFAPANMKDEIQKGLGITEGHFASILVAIGKRDPKDSLAKEWFDIAKNFHRIAHRDRENIHGRAKDSREMLDIWVSYEKILGKFIGSFYAVTNRLDVLLQNEIPPFNELPPGIKNLLLKPTHAGYFFGRLKHAQWMPLLQHAGFFDTKNAPPVLEDKGIPNDWMVLRYLVNMAKNDDEVFQKELKSVIDPIINNYTEGHLILNIFTLSNIVQIVSNAIGYGFTERELLFFKTLLSQDDSSISWFGNCITDEIPSKLIRQKNKVGLRIFLSFLFGFSVHEQEAIDLGEIKLSPMTKRINNVEEYYISKLLENHGNRIVNLLGKDAIMIVMDVLSQLYRKELVHLDIPSIEDTDQRKYWDGWEASLIDFVRDFSNLLIEEELLNIIDELLYSKVSILKRLGIHLVRDNFPLTEGIWWDFINNSTEPIHIHEAYLLIKETSPSYSLDQLNKIIDWIISICTVISEIGVFNNKDEAQDYCYFEIRRWLTSLNVSTVETQKRLSAILTHYNSLNNCAINHPEFDTYTSDIEPLKATIPSDFNSLTIQEQVDYIEAFKPEDEHFTSYRELFSVIHICASQEPYKYIYDLEKFGEINIIYLGSLFSGLTEALRNKKITIYLPIINFITLVLNQSNFWDQNDYNIRERFVSMIPDFLLELSKNENDFSFSDDEIEQVNNLIILLLHKTEDSHNEDIKGDLSLHLLTAFRGKLYHALLNIALLYSKSHFDTEGRATWPNVIKDYITNKLNEVDNTDRNFNIALGSFLPLLLYLDMQWVNENLHKIFYEENHQNFEDRLTSSLNGFYRPNKDLYNLLRQNNLFGKALDNFTYECRPLQIIVIYGLLEWEKWGVTLENRDSILSGILKKKNQVQYKVMIDVTWRKKTLSYQNIKTLWGTMLDIIESEQVFEDIPSMMLWFVEMASELDSETVSYTQRTLDSVSKEHRYTYNMLRFIYKNADSNLKGAADIVSKVYNSGLAMPYLEADLNSFVDKLYMNGLTQEANVICMCISDLGSLALRDIYNRHN